MRGVVAGVIIVSGIALGISAAQAAAPQLDYLFPSGAQRGRENIAITAGGKFEKWPVQTWTNAPEGHLTFVPKTGEKEMGNLTVSVAADCEPGPYLMRLFTQEGASEPRIFVVGTLPEETEAEPNDTIRGAQVLNAGPEARVINGKLEKRGDVDCFAVELAAGQTLVAGAAAYVIDSPVDPLLHVRGSNGYRIAFNHDAPGHLLDPRLVFTAPESGRYVVELAGFAHPPKADVRLTGSEDTRYRLKMSTAPIALHRSQLAVQRGTSQVVSFSSGESGGIVVERELSVPQQCNADSLHVNIPLFAEPVVLQVSDVPEFSESGETLAVPFGVTGKIAWPGESDRYAFTATKDTSYEFKVEAAAAGSALDAVLGIEGSDGVALATNDDASHRFDPQQVWKAPADGEFFAVVRSRFKKSSGDDHFYRLECLRAEPEVMVAAAAHAIRLKTGEKSELVLHITRRHGHVAALKIESDGLPEGIGFEPKEIPADAKGEWKLTFDAQADATALSLPFRLTVRDPGNDAVVAVKHALKGKYAETGEMLINEIADLWLTVAE